LASTDEFDPSAWLAAVAERLDQLGVPWVVAGAIAAQKHRLAPRFTTDLDLLVRWDDRLSTAFDAEGFAVRALADPGNHPHLLMLRRPDAKVDLIVAIVDYQHLAIDRGLATHVLTVEDVIIHKLIAWRPKDQDDIASILAAGHDLDHAYLDHWVQEWEVEDRWQEARNFGR